MSVPAQLESLFWDCDPESLDLERHRRFIMRRVVEHGGVDSMVWLRRQYGDDSLRAWLREEHGRGLSPPSLRFWSLILEIPEVEADEWVRRARQDSWHGRTAR